MNLKSFTIFGKLSIPKPYGVLFLISTGLAIVFSVLFLIFLNTSLMKIPIQGGTHQATLGKSVTKDPSENIKVDYNAILDRNLFRAKLEVEIPKPKSEKELEEERLTNIMRNLTLKGIWMGQKKDEIYAVIDKGPQKGVWSYEVGEIVEGGLMVSEIKATSVTLTKDDFVATLKLFAKGYERIPVAPKAETQGITQKASIPGKDGEKTTTKIERRPLTANELAKEVSSDGKTVVISKSLVDRIRADNSIVMSSVALKANVDPSGKANGFKIVSVDKGSLPDKMGILPNDVIQEINGMRIATAEDVKRAQTQFANANKFELKVLRNNQIRTLYYEIR
ncbi:MAG: PDZ domain-containing protein [Syntrophorhabdaceae bacterium]|nr:PDZ domain-containing protein [Syntrophorhabdaceae bacterium]